MLDTSASSISQQTALPSGERRAASGERRAASGERRASLRNGVLLCGVVDFDLPTSAEVLFCGLGLDIIRVAD
ncbi:hypothetical protein [Frankia sp. R82]|uniref:hypothetical protein n=1 Tax=Frankia sp. R82 TaxID=2950553 RepID=UPI0020448FFD|nr:hypothetical protein [Frankia sp. R82]MCM3882241.1 hypothetical protein [Frankia sp. R82]